MQMTRQFSCVTGARKKSTGSTSSSANCGVVSERAADKFDYRPIEKRSLKCPICRASAAAVKVHAPPEQCEVARLPDLDALLAIR
jgi:hypothetical protein